MCRVGEEFGRERGGWMYTRGYGLRCHDGWVGFVGIPAFLESYVRNCYKVIHINDGFLSWIQLPVSWWWGRKEMGGEQGLLLRGINICYR